MDSQNSLNTENYTAEPRVIVSLTTYPARIDRVHITIESLIRQTVPADMIVLWLAEEQFPEGERSLPEQLLAQKERGLVIEWCSDIKSYKKLIPAAEKWPEDIIITADDDIIYEMNTIARLLESYKKHPACISTLRTHLMLFDEAGQPLPYNDWKPEYSGFIDQPLMALFPTTGAGTLFPPEILPEETFNREAFMSLCPKADDVWVKCMLTLAGVPVVLVDVNTKLQYVEGTQSETLYSYNLSGNDEQLKAVLDRYNNVGGEEMPDDTLLIRMNDLHDYTPKDELCQKYRKGRSFVNEKTGVAVSVIVIAEDDEKYLKRLLTSLHAQTAENIEFICVDNASTDGTSEVLSGFAEQDGRISVITLDERIDSTAARRIAVLTSKGEYCLFPDVRGMLAPDACEQLYNRAENGDADILAFTSGVLNPHTSEADPVFIGNRGRIRNKEIILREFSADSRPEGKLSSCIFGGRITRKAYYHAEKTPAGGDVFDYFLLCRSAEVYEGSDTDIYYASPSRIEFEPEELSSSMDSVKEFIAFAGLEELFGPVADAQKIRMAQDGLEKWLALPTAERAAQFAKVKAVWPVPVTAAALLRAVDSHGCSVLRELEAQQLLPTSDAPVEHIGLAATNALSARELFTVTELLDCVAAGHRTTMIGVSKAAAASAVHSAKTNCVGEDLAQPDAQGIEIFSQRFDSIITEESIDAVILWTEDRNFIRMALHARLRGLPVIAAMTEAMYSSMTDCSVPAAGISALRLATVVVTDSPAQQRLLDTLGLPAKFIPRPALRTMGGRSGSPRASANAIVWAGEAENNLSRMNDAMEIFRTVRNSIPNARMLMFFDGIEDIDAIAASLPEGAEARRLRPDYGIFSDAALHLVTGSAGIASAAVRAGRTLGIPAVMYRMPDEQDSGAGAVTVPNGDRAAAAAEIIRLLGDKKRREHLGAQAKITTGGSDREEVARRWNELLEEVTSYGKRAHRMPEDELGRTLTTAMSGYEDGAMLNAARLEEFRQRCENYETFLAEAEARRIKETEALNTLLENTKAQLKEKERTRAHTAAELEDLKNSTLYKVGDIITRIPRYFKKLLASFKGGGQ